MDREASQDRLSPFWSYAVAPCPLWKPGWLRVWSWPRPDPDLDASSAPGNPFDSRCWLSSAWTSSCRSTAPAASPREVEKKPVGRPCARPWHKYHHRRRQPRIWADRTDRERDLAGVWRLSSSSPHVLRLSSSWSISSRCSRKKARSRATSSSRSAATSSSVESFRRSTLPFRRFLPSSKRRTPLVLEASSKKRAGSSAESTVARDLEPPYPKDSQDLTRTSSGHSSAAGSLYSRDDVGYPAGRLSSGARKRARRCPLPADELAYRSTAKSSVSSSDPSPLDGDAPRLRPWRFCAAGSPSWRWSGCAAACRRARGRPRPAPVDRKSGTAAWRSSLPAARRRNPERNTSNLGLGRHSHYATRVRITVPRSRRKLPKSGAKSDSSGSTIDPRTSDVADVASASPRWPSLARKWSNDVLMCLQRRICHVPPGRRERFLSSRKIAKCVYPCLPSAKFNTLWSES